MEKKPQNKIKIVGKVAQSPAPAKATGALPIHPAFPPVVKLKRPGGRLGPKGQRAIEILVESGGKKRPSVAMIEAGYSPKTAHTPTKLTESPEYKEKMEPFVQRLIDHRNALIAAMDEKMEDAEYSNLVYGMEATNRTIQLLTGRPTGRLGFALPEQEQQMIKELVIDNS